MYFKKFVSLSADFILELCQIVLYTKQNLKGMKPWPECTCTAAILKNARILSPFVSLPRNYSEMLSKQPQSAEHLKSMSRFRSAGDRRGGRQARRGKKMSLRAERSEQGMGIRWGIGAVGGEYRKVVLPEPLCKGQGVVSVGPSEKPDGRGLCCRCISQKM